MAHRLPETGIEAFPHAIDRLPRQAKALESGGCHLDESAGGALIHEVTSFSCSSRRSVTYTAAGATVRPVAYTICFQCCDFSRPANRTGGRWS